jgi:hypothetical protein
MRKSAVARMPKETPGSPASRRCSVGVETPMRLAHVLCDSPRRSRATARSAPSFSMAARVAGGSRSKALEAFVTSYSLSKYGISSTYMFYFPAPGALPHPLRSCRASDSTLPAMGRAQEFEGETRTGCSTRGRIRRLGDRATSLASGRPLARQPKLKHMKHVVLSDWAQFEDRLRSELIALGHHTQVTTRNFTRFSSDSGRPVDRLRSHWQLAPIATLPVSSGTGAMGDTITIMTDIREGSDLRRSSMRTR